MTDPYYRYGAPSDTGGSVPRPSFPGYSSSGAHSLASPGTLGTNDPRGVSSDLIRRDYQMNPLWHEAYGANDISGSRAHADHGLGGFESGTSIKPYPLHPGSHDLDDTSRSRVHSDLNGMAGTRDHYEAGFDGLATGASSKVYPSQPEANGLDDISGARLHYEPGFGGFVSGTSTKAYHLQPGARGLNDISGSQVQSNLNAGGFASGTTLKAYPLQPGARGVDDISGSQVHSEADEGGLTSGASTKGYPSLEDPKSLSQRRDVTAGVPDIISKRPSSVRNNGGVKVSGESNVLFVDGLPTDCTRREVGHLFRPFIGFEEIRVVHKEPRRSGDRAMVLCFVEFSDSKCALTALEALQGYKFDNKKPDSPSLRIHFAHFPFCLPADINEQQSGARR